MIKVSSFLHVVDNTGILEICCIRLLENPNRKGGSIGSFIIGTVKKTSSLNFNIKRKKNRKIFRKGDICKALIISVKVYIKRYSTFYIKADKNTTILLGDNFLPVASRILGPVL